MKITLNPHIKPICFNNKINNSYFNRSMSSDTVELSFKRKKKISDDHLQQAIKNGDTATVNRIKRERLQKELCKSGFREKEVVKTLSNQKSFNLINNYIETNGNNNFSREATLDEIYTIVSNEFDDEQANKYLRLCDINHKNKTPLSRVLKPKEMVYIAQNVDFENVPRFLELIDNNRDGEPFLSNKLTPLKAIACIEHNFDDMQADIFSQIEDNKYGVIYSSNIDFASDKKKCERFLYLSSEEVLNKFSRELTQKEKIVFIENDFNEEQIQTFINYVDSNISPSQPQKDDLYKKYEEQAEAENSQIKYYIDKFNFEVEGMGDSKIFSRSIRFDEALLAVKNNYDVEKTQKLINIFDTIMDKDLNFYFKTPNEMLYAADTLIKIDCTEEQLNDFTLLYDFNRFDREFSVENIINLITDKEKYTRFKTLCLENEITEKPADMNLAFKFVNNDFSNEKIQLYENLIKSTNEYNDYYIFNFLADEEQYEKFISLKNNPPKDIERKFTDDEIIYCVAKDLTENQIKTTAQLLNKFESFEMLEAIIELSALKSSKTAYGMNRFEVRDLLKKVINLYSLQRENISNANITLNLHTSLNEQNDTNETVPQTEEQSLKYINKLFFALGIKNLTPLNSNEHKAFISNIQRIAEQLKTDDVDKIDLRVLSLPQTEKLINNLNNDRLPLKVLKNVVNSPEYDQLSKKEKTILILSALFINIVKSEEENLNLKKDSAFEAFYICKSLGLSDADCFEIYTLINNSNWYEEMKDVEEETKEVSTTIAKMVRRKFVHIGEKKWKLEISKERKKEIIVEDVAFDLRNDKTFKLAKILCEANFIDKNFAIDEFNEIFNKIQKKRNEIKSTQIFLPQTKIPKASEVKNVKTMTADGVTNKVLYMDSAEDDLSVYGFEEGTTKKNWRALVHTFDSAKNLNILSTLNIVDKDSVLSTSYIDTDNYRTFRQQGLMLDVNSNNILAGYWRDFGSKFKKNTEDIKRNYIFPEILDDGYERFRQARLYIPDLFKEKLNLTDEEYIEKINKIENCRSIQDVRKIDEELADSLMPICEEIGYMERKYDRKYNEMLVAQRKVQGAFAYATKYEDVPYYIRKYAQDNDLLLILFGEKAPE